jgi:O-antigen ligase
MFDVFIVLVLYLPFQLALNPVTDIDLASIRVLIILLFASWLARGLKRKNIQIKNNLQTWLVLSFLFLNAFSILVAKNSDWSIRKLMFLFSVFPIYFVASQLISDKIRAQRVIKTIVFSATIVAGIGIVQFLLQFILGLDVVYEFWANFVISPFLGRSLSEAVLKNPSWLVNIAGQTYLRATSLFPDPHMLAFYLGLVLPLAGSMLVYKQSRQWLIVGSFSLILIADLLTFSRGGYLGIFTGLLFLGLFFFKNIIRKYKKTLILTICLIVALIIIPSPISQRFFSSFDLKEGSNQGRLLMWKKAAAITLAHPLIGVGIGNYPLAIKATATYREPIYAHNTYLDIAVETGVINMLVWIGILLVTMLDFWKKAKKDKIFLGALISLVIFSTHSLVETAIYSPIVLTIFLIILSLNNLKSDYEKIS